METKHSIRTISEKALKRFPPDKRNEKRKQIADRTHT